MGKHRKPTNLTAYLLLAATVLAGVAGASWSAHRPPPATISIQQSAPVNVSVQPPSLPPAPTPRVTVTVVPPRVTVSPRVVVTAPPREAAKTLPAARIGCLPPYPGEAHLGDRGQVARAWQAILIAAGVITDRPANRDSYFGPGTQARVAELQAGWGWDPVPGYAGPRTYRKLTQEKC